MVLYGPHILHFDFPDTWARQPLIPQQAKDVRVGIDLNNLVFINYRIEMINNHRLD